MGFVTDFLGMSGDAQQNPYKANEASLYNFDYTKGLGDAFGQALNNNENPLYGKVQDAYVNQIEGKAPSVAQLQLQDATEKNLAGAASRAASSRGINPAMAARLAMDSQTQTNSNAAGQAAILRAQEQQAAQSGLAGVLGQRQQLSNQLLGTVGGLQNQQNSARIQNAMGAQGINAGVAQQNAQLAAQAQAQKQGAIGGLFGAAGQAASMGLSGGMGGAPAAAIPGSSASDYTNLSNTRGSNAGDYRNLNEGGLIPGDHPKNDIVPAMLSPGEIVLPRSVSMSADAPEKAMAFVEALKKQKGKK